MSSQDTVTSTDFIVELLVSGMDHLDCGHWEGGQYARQVQFDDDIALLVESQQQLGDGSQHDGFLAAVLLRDAADVSPPKKASKGAAQVPADDIWSLDVSLDPKDLAERDTLRTTTARPSS
ncbi:hypothetical protein VTJ49DRAFT_524 [Mycothermus thermophilus]|uniref:Uncharacterized protein n=1 Tax=Humicola insolens TaxID=85995 RepID=A0ABR3VEW7_HUMIN